jgi:MarR family 2-MHQ and catechol resistance regulon transcriptional repressor
MSEVNLKLVIATARLYNSMFSRIEKNVQSFGLSMSEFGVLEMLYHKGEQPIQKIADKILVTSGTITYVINQLQKRELVYRKNCKKDKRVFYVCLTEKGENLITEVFPKHKEYLNKLFHGLEDSLKIETMEHLFKLQEVINNYKEEEL